MLDQPNREIVHITTKIQIAFNEFQQLETIKDLHPKRSLEYKLTKFALKLKSTEIINLMGKRADLYKKCTKDAIKIMTGDGVGVKNVYVNLAEPTGPRIWVKGPQHIIIGEDPIPDKCHKCGYTRFYKHISEVSCMQCGFSYYFIPRSLIEVIGYEGTKVIV